MPETPSSDDRKLQSHALELTLSGEATVAAAAIDTGLEADAVINLPITGEPS
ncbi:hypothetical protein ACFWAR_23615 [Streptomyces sp. NPDC059917]|uniref:hypothetical protein n=1 Tax=Streptomyces sp. NPDC059917 TaxID=3347002 RepID=UPI0036643E48